MPPRGGCRRQGGLEAAALVPGMLQRGRQALDGFRFRHRNQARVPCWNEPGTVSLDQLLDVPRPGTVGAKDKVHRRRWTGRREEGAADFDVEIAGIARRRLLRRNGEGAVEEHHDVLRLRTEPAESAPSQGWQRFSERPVGSVFKGGPEEALLRREAGSLYVLQ
ncbi:hypothetical protein D3C71_328810 [compost metagenome]